MTSTPVTILVLRSSLDSDRPSGTILQFGEMALCAGSGDPGFYFLDTNNAVRKIGPTAYGTTPPNAVYVGASGNSIGEAWTDSSPRNYYKVWNGTDWIKVSAGFSDTSTLASGAILASGAVFSNTATLASGAILASGASSIATVITSGLPNPTAIASGAAYLQLQSSGTYPSGLYIRAGSAWYFI